MNIIENYHYPYLHIELEEKLSLITAEAESFAANSQATEQKGEIISQK